MVRVWENLAAEDLIGLVEGRTDRDIANTDRGRLGIRDMVEVKSFETGDQSPEDQSLNRATAMYESVAPCPNICLQVSEIPHATSESALVGSKMVSRLPRWQR